MACGEFELDAAKEVKIGDRLKKLVDHLPRVHSMHYYHVPDLCVAENHYQNIPSQPPIPSWLSTSGLLTCRSLMILVSFYAFLTTVSTIF